MKKKSLFKHIYLFTKQKQIHRLREQIYGYWGKGGEEYIKSLGLTHTLLYMKWINMDLLYSTGNYTQYLIINHEKV